MNTWEHLTNAKKTLDALKKIAEDCDPASGLSFSVRRGVARDNEDVSDDHIRRPWVTVETGNLCLGQEAIRVLITAAEESLQFWKRATEKAILDAQTALENL